MKVSRSTTLKSQLTSRVELVESKKALVRAMPRGQRCLLLGYNIFTFSGLKTQFNFDGMHDTYYKEATAIAKQEFCTKVKMSESQFNETYNLRWSSNEDSVAFFKIATDDDIKDHARTMNENLRSMIDDVQQGNPTGDHEGMPIAMVMRAPPPPGFEPEFVKNVSKIVFAIEPFDLFCRDLIPHVVLECKQFAQQILELDDFYVCFVTTADSLDMMSPRMLIGRLGPQHYFIEIASWR
jgi:hypothetical protein